MVVTEQQRQRQGWPRLYGGDTAKHAKADRLAGCIASWSGEPDYVRINPRRVGHTSRAVQSAAVRRR